MGKVLFGLSVSLDGFIADKNDGVSEVFAWMGSARLEKEIYKGRDNQKTLTHPPKPSHSLLQPAIMIRKRSLDSHPIVYLFFRHLPERFRQCQRGLFSCLIGLFLRSPMH